MAGTLAIAATILLGAMLYSAFSVAVACTRVPRRCGVLHPFGAPKGVEEVVDAPWNSRLRLGAHSGFERSVFAPRALFLTSTT